MIYRGFLLVLQDITSVFVSQDLLNLVVCSGRLFVVASFLHPLSVHRSRAKASKAYSRRLELLARSSKQ